MRNLLISQARRIGPKYMAVTAMFVPILLTIYWARHAAQAIDLFLYILFLVSAVFIAGSLGAAAGIVIFPAAQYLINALGIPRSAWPISHAMFCGVLCGLAAFGYCLWVYDNVARLLRYISQPEVAIVMWGSPIAGLVVGYLVGKVLRNFANKSEEDLNRAST